MVDNANWLKGYQKMFGIHYGSDDEAPTNEKIFDNELGLKYVDCDDYGKYQIHEVIDQEKYFLAKLKYGI